MRILIEPTLYTDAQARRPALFCPQCGGERYTPTLRCSRCGRESL